MNWVDYCIIGVFLLSTLLGVWRGLTREIFSVLTWVVSIGAAWLLSDRLAEALSGQIANQALREAAAAGLLFFGALALCALITYFVVQAVRDSRFSPMDRTLGGGIGLLRAVIAVTLFVLISGRMGASDDRWWQDSKMVSGFTGLADGVATLIPDRWLAALEPGPSSKPSSPPGS
ncbi:MAG TPA: CvpA family protein [Solimonas sp.]|nr:CvpA family protein [Solimonas sp.]